MVMTPEFLSSNGGAEWRQIMAVLTASIGSFTAGLLFAWSSPSIPALMADDGPYRFTLEECSYLTVISPISTIFSSLIFAKLLDTVGRKYSAIILAIPYIAGLILIAVAGNVYVFYLARGVVGIGDAGMYSVLPTYVGEITTPKVRGTWGNSVAMWMYLGQISINVIGGYTSITTTALICLFFPVLFLCTFPLNPESPYYCMMKGNKEEARKALQILRQTDNVEVELIQLEADVRRQMSEPGSWKDLFMIKSNRKAVLAGASVRWFQQLCGISVFGVYTQYIFQQAGGTLSATHSAIIFQGAVTTGNLVCSFFLDKIGRRKATMCSLFCCAVVLSGVATFFFVSKSYPELDLSNFRWVPLAGMLLYVPVFSFGLGIVPTLLLGELFSASVKSKGLCVLNINLGFAMSFLSKVFQLMSTNIGLYSPFTLFAASCFVNTAVAYYVVPETKGKTLEEIQQDLRARKMN